MHKRSGSWMKTDLVAAGLANVFQFLMMCSQSKVNQQEN